MSALSDIIDSAILSVITEHPKLFAAQSSERVRKILVREIMRALTREPKGEASISPDEIEAAPAFSIIGIHEEAARAYTNLREVAGCVAPLAAGPGKIVLPTEANTAAVRAFLAIPDKKDWRFIFDRQQITAWQEFFAETLPGVSRRHLTEVRDDKAGLMLPWPWPPSKTGKIYESASLDEFA